MTTWNYFAQLLYIKLRGCGNIPPLSSINDCQRFLFYLHCLWFFYLDSLHSTFSNYQRNAQFLYYSTICVLHYDPQHVSISTLLILRRTNCITTASGIVTLCKQPYSMHVESGLQSALHMHTVRLSVEWRYQRLWWYNLSSWGWGACCSKHVEDRSVTYILLKNKGIVHYVGNLKKSILWYTFRKTSNYYTRFVYCGLHSYNTHLIMKCYKSPLPVRTVEYWNSFSFHFQFSIFFQVFLF